VDGGRRYWVEVLQQERPLHPSRVHARVEGYGRIRVVTENVAALALYPEPWEPADAVWELRVDESRLRIASPLPLLLEKTNSGWRTRRPDSPRGRRLLSLPEKGRCHGLKAALLEPFLLVYGASGSPQETQASLDVARNLARIWWYRGNGDVRIVSDRDLLRQSPPLPRLVLIGNAASNRLLARLGDLYVDRTGVRLPGEGVAWAVRRRIPPGADVSVAAVVEDPLVPGRLALVYGGSGPEAILRAGAAQPFFSGAGWPDILVFDDAFRSGGLGEVLASGIWLPARVD
jgi:hypothetical protein